MENDLLVLKLEREIHATELEIQKEMLKVSFSKRSLFHSALELGKANVLKVLLNRLFER